MWSTGSVSQTMAKDGGLVSLLDRTALREPLERVVITTVVCKWCGWDQFEVVGDECFCEGCCLPVGMADGDVYTGGSAWELAPSASPLPWPREAFRESADPACPAGHDVFQVAVAFALAVDGRVRRLSVGLRCPVDGALCLHLDNVHVVSSRT
ncbi:hypothetical protein J116_000010 [Streptomyces thermolilacinus SPC6]|uniref:Uncharacterized protein n=1 Tax=Streptomyces thermolilacinus SPC6 TaxID=1306406 RepID=A0A1D3DLC9_9ACTN|nr:hypothetical protein J116_000010 [Streptomyces thermolilacinus SPC6]